MVYGNTEPYLGVVLQYPDHDTEKSTNTINMGARQCNEGAVGIGVVHVEALDGSTTASVMLSSTSTSSITLI